MVEPAEIEHAVTLLAPAHVLTDTSLDVAVPTSPLSDLTAAFDEPAIDAASVPHTDPDATALVLFTSGSSGMPKAVELSRRAVIANQHNILARNRRFPTSSTVTPHRPSASRRRRCSTSVVCPAC